MSADTTRPAELEAIDGPAPDWADLREMARNAGWTHRRLARGWTVWTIKDASVHIRRPWPGAQTVNVDGDFGDLVLNEPTPARVLNIAREMGLEVSHDVAS